MDRGYAQEDKEFNLLFWSITKNELHNLHCWTILESFYTLPSRN